MTRFNELSIFFPFWNEQDNLERVVLKAADIAPRIADKWEIVMVDDGSSDKTLEIMQSLSKKDERFVSVSHNVNRGYGAALKTGIEKSRYDYVVFNDGDGQFDFSEVTKFMEKIDIAE